MTTTRTTMNHTKYSPMSLCANACTLAMSPERVRNVPKMVMKNVRHMQEDVPDLEHAVALLHERAVQVRRAREPRHERRVLDRVPGPIAAPAELLVAPQAAEQEAEREESPGDHRPGARHVDPLVVEPPESSAANTMAKGTDQPTKPM
jgi:hypothetical protein